MPDILGTLKAPRLSASPSAPVVGQMYYDTGANELRWFDGTSWIPAKTAALPGRLGVNALLISDWNNALDNGWYVGSGIPNQPVADGNWYMGEVTAYSSSWITQRVSQFTAGAGAPIWERKMIAGAWQSWVQVVSQARLSNPTTQYADCNACLDTGWYCLNGPTNSPAGVSNNQLYMEVINWQQGAYLVQVIYVLGANEIWTRQLHNSTWQAWVKTFPAAASTDLSFDGDWVAGTYQEGDTVVKDGVVFLCVGGPTSVAPDATLWGSLGPLPTVVNGKWIKGVGGASVWSDITYADITGTPPVSAPGYGTSLPASPTDTQEYILVDSLTAPTYAWRFRYVASITDAYKWVLVGGAPVINEVPTAEATSTNNAYVDLTTVGPQFTVPRAGIYEITPSFNAYGSNIPQQCAVKLGAATTSNLDGFGSGAGANGAGAGNNISSQSRIGASRTFRRTLAASDLLKMQYRVEPGGSGSTFADRTLRVLPLRVA